MSPVLDVTAAPYSARGDGGGNDRGAIQGALDAAARAGGGTVLLPSGCTFLSGNLTIDNRTTLQIDGRLRQSQDSAHYSSPLLLGHRKPGQPQSYITWFDNPPLIFANDGHDITVTGSGVVEMTHQGEDATDPRDRYSYRGVGSDDASIHVVPIALHRVHNFEISDLTILFGTTHQILVYWCRHGIVRDTTVQVYPTTESFGRHHVANTDAVHVGNSQDVRVTGNHFDQIDNSVVLISRYADPRESTAWWSSAEPMPCRSIEVDHNVIKTSHGGVVFLPWGPGAPDQAAVEIADVHIHHNEFEVGIQPLQIREDYVYDPGPQGDNHSPVKEIRVHDNTYRTVRRHSRRLTRRAQVSDLKGDVNQLSHAEVLNGGFEHALAYWSARGNAGAGAAGTLPLQDPEAKRASQQLAARWPRQGYLQGFPSDPALYQGLGLIGGVPYTVRLEMITSGQPVRLFVRNTDTGENVAEQLVDHTGPRQVDLNIRPIDTCDSYHVGVDGVPSETGWALIGSMQVEPAARLLPVDDEQLRYTGSWETIHDVNLLGDAYRETSQPGATAELDFAGTRAWWFGLRDWVYGRADVFIDGCRAGTIDCFNDGAWPAWVDHQLLVDTGILAMGEHTITIVCTADRDPRSMGLGVALDAILVES